MKGVHNFGKTKHYTRYYLFSPLYRQCHFALALADEPGTARCHYLTRSTNSLINLSIC